MNDLLAEIYSTIIPSAPYLIAAYVLIIVVLFVFLGVILSRVSRAEKQLSHIEEQLERKQGVTETQQQS